MLAAWPLCLERLEAELSAEDVHTWIKPLRAERHGEQLLLLAPNHHVLRWVRSNLLAKIESRVERFAGNRLDVNLVLDEKPADVEPALMDAFARKDELVFLDFLTDQKENVYPMVPGGKGITEMILYEDL